MRVCVQARDCSSSFVCVLGKRAPPPPDQPPLLLVCCPGCGSAVIALTIQQQKKGEKKPPSARLFFLFCYGNEIFHLTLSSVLKYLFAQNRAV